MSGNHFACASFKTEAHDRPRASWDRKNWTMTSKYCVGFPPFQKKSYSFSTRCHHLRRQNVNDLFHGTLLHGFLHCVRELRNIDHAEVDGCLRVLQLFLEICSVDFHHEAFHESMDVASCNLCAPRWNEVAGRPSFVFRKLFDGGADRNIALIRRSNSIQSRGHQTERCRHLMLKFLDNSRECPSLVFLACSGSQTMISAPDSMLTEISPLTRKR